jgi:hypothetical protein
MAASLFADVDGLTAHIDGAQTADRRRGHCSVLHLTRKEMAAVVKHDSTACAFNIRVTVCRPYFIPEE